MPYESKGSQGILVNYAAPNNLFQPTALRLLLIHVCWYISCCHYRQAAVEFGR